MPSTQKSALVLIFDDVEEIEALTPIDILRRANIEVTIATIGESLSTLGRNQITVLADTFLEKINPEDFDLFFLPGGPGVLKLIDNETILGLLQKRAQRNQLTAAICAAPKILAAAGLLTTIPATGHQSIRADLPIPSNERVVHANTIITSQGVGTAIELSLEIVKQLTDQQTADQIAAAIHF